MSSCEPFEATHLGRERSRAATRTEPSRNILDIATRVGMRVGGAHPVAPRLIDERRSACGRIPVAVAEVVEARVGNNTAATAALSGFDDNDKVESVPRPQASTGRNDPGDLRDLRWNAHHSFVRMRRQPLECPSPSSLHQWMKRLRDKDALCVAVAPGMVVWPTDLE